MHLRQTVQLRNSRHLRIDDADALASFGEKRRCEVPECTTVLSRYNPSLRCSAHQGWEDPRKRRMG